MLDYGKLETWAQPINRCSGGVGGIQLLTCGFSYKILSNY